MLLLVAAGAMAEQNYEDYYAEYAHLSEVEGNIGIGQTVAAGQSLEISVTMERDAFVYPQFTYRLLDDTILDFGYVLAVDGVIPYTECNSLMLDSWWAASRDFPLDRYGNEVAPLPDKVRDAFSQGLAGKEAIYAQDMGLFLTAGEHTLRLTATQGTAELISLSFVIPAQTPQTQPHELTGENIITLQGEQADRRNSANIRVGALYNTQLEPYSSDGKRINYIEDGSWKYAGDKLVYTFQVEQEGYYGLSLRCRQSGKTDFPVWRTALIDGAVPSSAFENFAIDSALNFENYIVRDEQGNPATVYLTAGEHTLTLNVTVTPIWEEINTLNRISEEMSALGLEVSKITGGNTDTYRDFDLSAYGLDVETALMGWKNELEASEARLNAIAGVKESGEISYLRLAIELLDSLMEKPNDLPKRLAIFSQGSSSARFYVISTSDSLRLSPLGLDSVSLFQDEKDLPTGMNGLESVMATINRFGASFSAQSYEATGSDGETLQVWLNRPRQILEILQQMVDAQFTPATGIKVDLSIMPDASKLVLANASGTSPDVAIGIASGSVVDMAVRGMLVDMRRFDTFKEVGRRFTPGLMIPGAYQDGCYALPETFHFYVLFYRTDIMESLGLEVPNTMEEVREMLPTLQRFGMNYNSFVANSAGYKGFAITLPYIVQNGGKLFESGSMKTLLGSDEALDGIRQLTNDFIMYSMDFEVSSFYQSFRDGVLPIGTSTMGTYMQLLNAAPEIAGKWDIALFPGIEDENGEIQRWTCNAGESSIIFKSSQMQDEAWKFLDWYMSDEVQTEFGYRLTAIMGNEYLWNSANLNAFMASSWPEEDKAVIAEQLKWTYEPSRILGAYMVERELSNAINAIVQDHENLRSAMDEAIKRIDREVQRKMDAYGLKEEDFIMIDVETIEGWLK